MAMLAPLFGAGLYFASRSRFFSTLPAAEPAFKEILVENPNDLEEGEMREVKFGEKDDEKFLLVRYEGKLRAVGNFCSHFGAPLARGVLFDDKVLCPFHCMGFSVVSGYPEQAVALDGIPVFDVVEKDGQFFVRLPDPLPRKATVPMSGRDKKDKRRFVIIGAGPAGISAAETLRQCKFGGEVVLLTSEEYLPFDRTILSKNLMADANKLALRS